MNIEQIERAVVDLCGKNHDRKSFLWDLLAAYDTPQASLTRLRKGDYNLSKVESEVLWKKKVAYRFETTRDLHESIAELADDPRVERHSIRFVVVTDLHGLLAQDTKTGDSLDIEIPQLPKHFDFFLPWAGMEKARHRSENPADIKAAERMGRLYDLIVQENELSTEAQRHDLNVFLARLLFCFFAEDTGIFQPDQFTNAIATHTVESGEDMQSYLSRLFDVLNTEDRSDYPKFLQDFPYVNGGLFAQKIKPPKFSTKSRRMIVEAGELNWKAINPDILGSMMQAVVHGEKRDGLGMHYTSVTNILKVLDPLLLDELRAQLAEAGESKPKLQKLLERIYGMRVFDPACGSGNFLVIAYKELARIEIEALRRVHGQQLTAKFTSRLATSQFYGIEIDDFAHETAKLSLWLAEHQMNVEFKDVFGTTRPTLPLKEGGKIVQGNATRLDWEKICAPPVAGEEVYIVGNPPYAGARTQTKAQKADMDHVYGGHKDFKDSDYVSCWVLKGAKYINGRTAFCAFVTTNSVCQGEQVSYLWPRVWTYAELGFAYRAFKWTNNARGNAGVTCVVLGLRNRSPRPKVLYSEGRGRAVRNITPYLSEGDDVVVFPENTSLSGLPKMVMGTMPRDGGHLILSPTESQDLVRAFPEAGKLLKAFVGTQEFLDSTPRACLWIEDKHLDLVEQIEPIRRRVDGVRAMRLSSDAKTTQQYATTPHKMAQRAHKDTTALIVPGISSEHRPYIPLGFLDGKTVISNRAYAVYDASPALFGLLSSRMHVVWVKAVSGGFETRISYSSSLSYNTFPVPMLDQAKLAVLEERAFDILHAREQYPERTIAELYDPDSMPKDLLAAHQTLDCEIERAYRKRPFLSDEERLEFLFAQYVSIKGRPPGEKQQCLIS